MTERRVVGRFNQRLEADLAAARLRDQGFDATVRGDDWGGQFPLHAMMTGGYVVEVPEDDAQNASASHLGTIEATVEAEPDHQGRIGLIRIGRLALGLSVFLSLIALIMGFGYLVGEVLGWW